MLHRHSSLPPPASVPVSSYPIIGFDGPDRQDHKQILLPLQPSLTLPPSNIKWLAGNDCRRRIIPLFRIANKRNLQVEALFMPAACSVNLSKSKITGPPRASCVKLQIDLSTWRALSLNGATVWRCHQLFLFQRPTRWLFKQPCRIWSAAALTAGKRALAVRVSSSTRRTPSRKTSWTFWGSAENQHVTSETAELFVHSSVSLPL